MWIITYEGEFLTQTWFVFIFCISLNCCAAYYFILIVKKGVFFTFFFSCPDPTACKRHSKPTIKVQQFKSINLKWKLLSKSLKTSEYIFFCQQHWDRTCSVNDVTIFYNGVVTVAVTSYSSAQCVLKGDLVIYLPAGPLVWITAGKTKG